MTEQLTFKQALQNLVNMAMCASPADCERHYGVAMDQSHIEDAEEKIRMSFLLLGTALDAAQDVVSFASMTAYEREVCKDEIRLANMVQQHFEHEMPSVEARIEVTAEAIKKMVAR